MIQKCSKMIKNCQKDSKMNRKCFKMFENDQMSLDGHLWVYNIDLQSLKLIIPLFYFPLFIPKMSI